MYSTIFMPGLRHDAPAFIDLIFKTTSHIAGNNFSGFYTKNHMICKEKNTS